MSTCGHFFFYYSASEMNTIVALIREKKTTYCVACLSSFLLFTVSSCTHWLTFFIVDEYTDVEINFVLVVY